MTPSRVLPAVMLLALACACARQAPVRVPEGPPPPPAAGKVLRSGGFLEATARGFPDPMAGEQTQRRSTSRDAAIFEARRLLVGFVKKMKAPYGGTVGRRAERDGLYAQRLNTWAEGAPVTQTRWDDDDSAVATVTAEESALRVTLDLGK